MGASSRTRLSPNGVLRKRSWRRCPPLHDTDCGGPRMSPVMTTRIALKALARNKMRTALTMLGMIIGVAAVISLVALGRGAQQRIEDQIKSGGTNLITVM